MTVSTATSRVDYTGNGVTTAFAVPFPFIDDTYLQVIRTIIATGVETTLVLNSGGADGYTVSGAGQATGTVTVVTALSTAHRLSIIRAVPGTQEADFVANDPFPAETFESSLDKLQMQINDNATRASRSPVLYDSDLDGSGRYNSNGNRYANAADGVSATDLATVQQITSAGSGSFVQAGSGSVIRTMQNKAREIVSLEDFGATGDGVANAMPALAAALAAGHKQIRLVPGKTYKMDGSLTIAQVGIRIEADGANVILGNTLAAGDNAFIIAASDFAWQGGNLTAAVRVTGFRVDSAGGDISDFSFEGINFNEFFYDIVGIGDSAANRNVKNLTIRGCSGIAPVGVNAGHFLAINVDGVTMADNEVAGGYNSSVYGAQNCTNITITGNRERGVVDTVANVEAAIQIEGIAVSADTQAVVTGNQCQHDIWLSDAYGVTVTGNNCRLLRLTVGNPGTTGGKDNLFTGNRCAAIIVQEFGTAGANRVSAEFRGNQIDPNGISILGTPLAFGIFIDGAVCERIYLSGNRIVSNSTANAFQFARAAGCSLYAFDNEFGTQANLLSGSGGYVYEKNNRNPLYPTDNGYIGATLSADLAMGEGAWTALLLNSEQIDVNGEWNTATGRFTPTEDGNYRFSGGFLWSSVTAGDEMGIRLLRVSGASEARRLVYDQSGGAGFNLSPVATTTLRLSAGEVIELQYFHDAAAGVGSILAGAVFTQLQITRDA